MNRSIDNGTADLPRQPARRSAIAPFIVMDVISAAARREAQGRQVIHMEVGQPGTPAPAIAREAVKQRIDLDTLGYTEGLGIPPLRSRISRHYRDQHGLDIAPERIIVTTGSSAAFVLTFLTLFDAGETVLLPSPGYPCYRHILRALDIGSALITTGAADRWMPTPEAVAAAAQASGAAGLLVASPSNPTGTMLEPERLGALIETCRQRRMWFVSDEIYHGLTYTLPARSALSFSDDVIVINSFSKYFSMTGWRVGWMVVPPALVRSVERLGQNLYISAPAASQAAALAAFEAAGELEANRSVYAANRRLLLDGLPKVGIAEFAPADGAFYLYADVSAFIPHEFADSAAMAASMLEELDIAVTPGIDFDEARGINFLRFSYSGPTADMAEAVRRLEGWDKLKGRSSSA